MSAGGSIRKCLYTTIYGQRLFWKICRRCYPHPFLNFTAAVCHVLNKQPSVGTEDDQSSLSAPNLVHVWNFTWTAHFIFYGVFIFAVLTLALWSAVVGFNVRWKWMLTWLYMQLKLWRLDRVSVRFGPLVCRCTGPCGVKSKGWFIFRLQTIKVLVQHYCCCDVLSFCHLSSVILFSSYGKKFWSFIKSLPFLTSVMSELSVSTRKHRCNWNLLHWLIQ